MNIYYWNAHKNFGDLLTPLLLKKFAKLNSTWVEPAKAELISVGSILEHMPDNWGGVIVGSGKLHEGTRLGINKCKILALRGPLTAHKVKGNFAIADPGLLADELISNQDKVYDLGIIPHWTDKKLEHNPLFTKYNPKIIRVTDDPIKVITEIAQCKKIVSSSFHGLVLADAFGIPRRTEISETVLALPQREGGTFKFRDYSESIGLKFEVGVTQEADRNKITELQNELFDVFEEVKSLFN